ncbi:hypothetical protein MP228_002811 [Amoeboaphelidium protococcarum]|nr:hypothetical protein MP228_002811 [Amoeboaphelidium protococcarum]
MDGSDLEQNQILNNDNEVEDQLSMEEEDDDQEITDGQQISPGQQQLNQNIRSYLNKQTADMTKAGNKVWLVKVPDFLMDVWSKTRPQSELGHLSIDAAQVKNSMPKITLEVNRNLNLLSKSEFDPAILPKNYNLQISNNPPGNLFTFSTDTVVAEGADRVKTMRGGVRLAATQEYTVGVEGCVQHECNVIPVMDADYRNILRLRKEKAEQPVRVTKKIGDYDSETQKDGQPQQKRSLLNPTIQMSDSYTMGSMAGLQFGSAAALSKASKKRKQEQMENRYEKLPRDEVINMMFKAYEQTPAWSVQGMSDHTRQPVTYVKELLNQIAFYIKSGQHKGMYELKDEFKQQSSQDPQSSSLQQQK